MTYGAPLSSHRRTHGQRTAARNSRSASASMRA